jgi:ketosteroid isomerase-like protein
MGNAEKLVLKMLNALPDYQKACKYLHDDIVWRFPEIIKVIGGAHVGKAAVKEMLEYLFREIYFPEGFKVNVIKSVGNDEVSAVHYRNTALTRKGFDYDTEYMMMVRVENNLIIEIDELVDTASAFRQFAGRK